MEPFVKATHVLEGDSVLSMRESLHLHSHIVANHHPNVAAVTKHLANGNTTNKQMILRYAKNFVKPAYDDYFKKKFNNDVQITVDLFKTAKFFPIQSVRT